VFARTHARVRVELRIGRSAELSKAFDEGAVDVLIAMRLGPAMNEVGIVREPMLWLSARQGLAVSEPELPLAVLDPPCGFRSAAITALERAHRPRWPLSSSLCANRRSLLVTCRNELAGR
jgi:hypothetical protein